MGFIVYFLNNVLQNVMLFGDVLQESVPRGYTEQEPAGLGVTMTRKVRTASTIPGMGQINNTLL